MARIKQGVLGPIKGKLANLVGATWKGIHYLRIMPANFTDARTPAQLNQRSKFLVVLRFLRPLLSFIKVGYKGYAERMSAYNAAMSYLIKNAVIGEFPDLEIAFASVLVSRGNLRGVTSATASASGDRKILVEWPDNSDMDDVSANDQAIVVVYNAEKMDVSWKLQAAFRSDGQAEVTLPQSYVADSVQVFLAFGSIPDLVNAGTKDTISDSIYVGQVVVS